MIIIIIRNLNLQTLLLIQLLYISSHTINKQNKYNNSFYFTTTLNSKNILKLMNGTFQHYQHLRLQQIHHNKIINPELNVPKHEAYKPINPNIQQAKIKLRLRKQAEIEHQNRNIIKKLFTINTRKPKSLNLSHSTKTLAPISLKKKSFQTPEHQRQNNNIALRLINTKSSIDVKSQLKDYHQNQRLKKSLSRYQTIDGQNGVGLLIDRKKYIAELMMLKKLKISQSIESRVKNYIRSNPLSSRLSKISSEISKSQTIKT